MANSGGGGGNASGVRAGRAYVELGTSDKGLAEGLAAAERRLKKFGEQTVSLGLKVGGAGLVAAAGLGKIASEFVERGDALKKASDRIGDTAENVSALGYAAEMSGTNLEGLEGGIHKMQKALAEAAEKGGETADALADVGLSATELSGKTPTEQLFAMADALDGLENPTKRNAFAMRLMGRSASELIPLLGKGGKELRALMKEAGDVGAIVSGERAAAAEKIADSLQRSWLSLKYAVQEVAAVLVPQADAIEAVSHAVVDALKVVREWIGRNPALAATIAGVTAAVLVGGAALVVFGFVAQGAAAGLGALATAGTLTLGVLSLIATPGGVAIGILTGLTAAIGYLLVTTEKGQGVLTYFGNGWRELADIFEQTWGGINDALASGDLEAAGNIAMAGLKAAWLQLTLNLRKFWDDFTNHFVQGWKSALLLVRNELIKTQSDYVDVLGFIGKKTGIGGFVDFFGAGTKQRVDAELKASFAAADIKAGDAPKSPDVLAIEKARDAAKAHLDELTGAAALNRIILDEERGKGAAAALGSLGGAGALSRGTFGTRGFASQAFGGGGQPLTELVQLQRGNNQKLNDIDLHLQEIAKKGLVLT